MTDLCNVPAIDDIELLHIYRNTLLLMAFRAHDQDGCGIPLDVINQDRYAEALLLVRQAGWVCIDDDVMCITQAGIAWWRAHVSEWCGRNSNVTGPAKRVLTAYTKDGSKRKGKVS